jgi:hypothetical protein
MFKLLFDDIIQAIKICYLSGGNVTVMVFLEASNNITNRPDLTMIGSWIKRIEDFNP